MATGIVPYLSYRDPDAAIAFLADAFGARTLVRWEDGGIVQHAEVAIGDATVMLGTADHQEPDVHDRSVGQGRYLAVDDVDAHFKQAEAAGAIVVFPPEDTEWGTRRYRVLDPEGYEWSAGSYRPGETGG